jgi:spermidine/putrescine transport system permease protein
MASGGNIGRKRLAGLAPAWTVIGVLMVVPVLIMGVYSLLEADPYGGVEWRYSHEAYIQLFFERDLDDSLLWNPIYLNIILRSLGLAAITTIACLLIAFPIAYYITRQPEHRRNLWIYLITIPFWTNLLIRTYAWILILNRNGVVDGPLQLLGLPEGTFDLMYSNTAILVGLVYSYIPLMVLPIYASLEKLDFRLVEAASDLYAGKWRTLREIIIPLAMPGIVAGSILVFVPSLGAFIAPDLLGGGKRMMLGTLVSFQFGTARNWPFGAALAILLMAVVMIMLMIYARMQSGSGEGRKGAPVHGH